VSFFFVGAVLLKYFMSSDMFPFVNMDADNNFPVCALLSFLQCFILRILVICLLGFIFVFIPSR